MALRKFLYVAVDAQRVAIPGSGLCEEDFTDEKIQENLHNSEGVQYIAVREDPEIACQVCGYQRLPGWRP